MNEPGTALTLPARAALALNSAEHEAKLKELAASSVSITAITNPASYDECHSARMALKTMRVLIERTGKSAREDATAFSKAVIAEEKRLVAIIQPEEYRLERIQSDHDAIKEREKQDRIEAEAKRVTDIQTRIAAIRDRVLLVAALPVQRIAGEINDLEQLAIDESFAEFQDVAADAKLASLSKLRELHAAAVGRAAEQARIAAEREELARLRAEAQQREATERARIAEEERKAKVERDAEAARQAEQLRQQREEEAKLAAERQAIIDAENARIRAEQAAAQAEIDRQAQEQRDAKQAEQAERARQEEEHRHLNQMRMSEISGIQQQATIAVTGRPGVRKGGTLECIKDTLAETEAWPIEESNFGPLTAVAQSAKDIAIAAIRDSLETFERKSSLDALEAQQAEVRRQQEEAQRQQAEAARLAAIKKPADTELIRVLADHYRVPANKVREWLRGMKLTQTEAA